MAREKFDCRCFIVMVMLIARMYTLVKTLHILYVKWVYFIISKLYLNKVDIKSVVEDIRESKAVGCIKGSLEVISRNYNGTFFPAVPCSLEFEIGKINVAGR